MKEQIFRFCLSCTMVTLIKKGRCHCCNGQFILSSPNDDLHKRPKYAKSYESIL
jgi:hypothetical protein